MKYLAVALAGLGLVAVVGLYTGNYLADTSELLLDQAFQVRKLVQEGDWEGARQKLDELTLQWDQYKGRWELFIDHTEVDTVDEIVGRIRPVLAARDKVRLQLELESLLRRLRDVPEKYNFKWQNIL